MSLPQFISLGTTTNGADSEHLALVREAAARGRELMAIAAATAAAERAEEQARLDAAWDAANHAIGLPAWTLQYIDVPEPGDDPAQCTIRRLELPACSPIIVKRESRFHAWDTAHAYALVAAGIGDDPEYHIQHKPGAPWPLELFDLAIADAADAGPQWHALSLEVERLNERAANAQPEPQTPDLIDQTHVLIREFSVAGTETMDAAILVATGLLAVAEQVLRLREHLEGVQEASRDIAF